MILECMGGGIFYNRTSLSTPYPLRTNNSKSRFLIGSRSWYGPYTGSDGPRCDIQGVDGSLYSEVQGIMRNGHMGTSWWAD